VAVAVAWRGGYTDGARGVVAALAGLAALAAVAAVPEAAGRAARHPIVLTLAALAAVTALSGAWTIGAPSDAARDAAAVLALCALVVAAASLPAPWGHAGVLLVAAVASAISGLAATIATSEPLALDLCGSWRPAGPFEYPPALALICAGALPVALCAATERRRALGVPGALAAWLLVTTVALTANRSGIGLSALAVTMCVALAPRARAVGPVALAVIVATAVVLGDRGSPCGADPSHGRVGIWRAALHTAQDRPLQGYGAGTFLAATRERQLKERAVPTRFAHDLALQAWVELGIAGLLAVLAWYVAVGWTLARELWPPRVNPAAWLLAPAVAAFPLANLLDWPWALIGTGALWAVAVGGLLAARHEPEQA
jgi:O-antigen ligase